MLISHCLSKLVCPLFSRFEVCRFKDASHRERMKKMKCLSTTVRVFFVALLFATASCFALSSLAWASDFPENDNLSSSEISERFHSINATYQVGEEFNDSDADFVLRYGKKPSSIALYGSDQFNISGSGSGTTVKASGTLYHNGTFQYTYGGNVTITKTAGPTPKKLTLTVHCTSYGVVGSGGVGIIYNDGVSASKSNASTFVASPSRTYTGYMTVYSVEAWVDVTTSSGNFFTVHG